MLNEINSEEKLQSILSENPFKAGNIMILISVLQPDGKNVYYPDIQSFFVSEENITYATKVPEQEKEDYTKEVESFEEALKIVNSSDV